MKTVKANCIHSHANKIDVHNCYYGDLKFDDVRAYAEGVEYNITIEDNNLEYFEL